MACPICSVDLTGSTLHIVDGDSTAGTLRQAGFDKQGNILSWRDALYSGPVPEGVTLRQLSRLRSRFWTNGKRSTEFDERNSKLAKYAGYEEVVLWFGSDCTLCELSLIQLLSWFQELKKAPARLSWVTRHGGVLKPAQMVHAHAARKVVTSPQLSFAARIWLAFRSPSPASLDRLVNGSMRVVPGLDNAIRWIGISWNTRWTLPASAKAVEASQISANRYRLRHCGIHAFYRVGG